VLAVEKKGANGSKRSGNTTEQLLGFAAIKMEKKSAGFPVTCRFSSSRARRIQ
jgi:hypothetical protein